MASLRPTSLEEDWWNRTFTVYASLQRMWDGDIQWAWYDTHEYVLRYSELVTTYGYLIRWREPDSWFYTP